MPSTPSTKTTRSAKSILLAAQSFAVIARELNLDVAVVKAWANEGRRLRGGDSWFRLPVMMQGLVRPCDLTHFRQVADCEAPLGVEEAAE